MQDEQTKQPGRYCESARTGAWYVVWLPMQYQHGKVVVQCTDGELQPAFNPNGTPKVNLLDPGKIKLKAFLD